MASLPVMFFFIILLLASILIKGRILTQTQKEPTISADHQKNPKAVTVDSQREPNIQEDFERMLCAINQEQNRGGSTEPLRQHPWRATDSRPPSGPEDRCPPGLGGSISLSSSGRHLGSGTPWNLGI
uniref:Exocrine gland-secreting peptide 2 n=1 Tax=Mus musculus TaxID=10090 RepID=A8R0T6_MOUSE|nr:exocrine gland-secreting peptide 2 [Mus musculus]